MQAVIDFPFQNAARRFASQSLSADELRVFFAGDDWYTDADSNVYGLPTFLGNHDMGRIGNFVKSDNPGAVDAELMARDLLAHELMYLSRGNPVVYYGDEQGFVGDGGDQDARQDMFPSQVATYNDDDLIGTDATTAVSNFDPTHPLYRAIGKLARLTQRHEALRDGAQIHRLSATAAGVYAFSRIDRRDQREYVVVLNNSEQPQTATIPTYSAKRDYLRVYGEGRRWLESNRSGGLTVTVGPLSAIVYKLWGQIPRSKKAPRITLGEPTPAAESRARIEVPATVDGTSFYEVTFLVKADRGAWTRIGTDDSPPYRVFHDVSALPTGTPLKYKAVVLDNKHHTRVSDARSTAVPAPKVTIEVPAEGSRVRDTVSLRAVVDPERATHVVRFERMLDGGEWTLVGSDDSSPAYSADDDISVLDLAPGTPIHYRAVLTEPDGTTATSDVRTVAAAGPPLEFAVVRYFRPAADYTNWGLHLWGEAVDPDVLAMVAWDRPWPLTRIEGAWAVYEIPLAGRHAGGQLHHAPAERRHGAGHPRAGWRPLLHPARPPGDLAQAGRPGGVLQPAARAVGTGVERRRGRRTHVRAAAAQGISGGGCPACLDRRAVRLVRLLEREGARRRAVRADVVDARQGLVDVRERAGLDPPQRLVHLRVAVEPLAPAPQDVEVRRAVHVVPERLAGLPDGEVDRELRVGVDAHARRVTGLRLQPPDEAGRCRRRSR